ncbi:MAG: hypothetical protein ABEI13_01880 [Candidatus Paceibacteria bacterium]
MLASTYFLYRKKSVDLDEFLVAGRDVKSENWTEVERMVEGFDQLDQALRTEAGKLEDLNIIDIDPEDIEYGF